MIQRGKQGNFGERGAISLSMLVLDFEKILLLVFYFSLKIILLFLTIRFLYLFFFFFSNGRWFTKHVTFFWDRSFDMRARIDGEGCCFCRQRLVTLNRLFMPDELKKKKKFTKFFSWTQVSHFFLSSWHVPCWTMISMISVCAV